MKTHLYWRALFLLLALAATGRAEINLLYLRHAEGGHNVVRKFQESGMPTNEWPAYVGKDNAFSPEGEAQAQAVVAPLQKHTFDLIAVSPTWRTRNTILPYLKATGQKAEIWPELAETANTDVLPSEGEINPDLWSGKRAIRLSAEEADFFHLRADPPGLHELVVSNRLEAVACAERVETLLRDRFNDQPARVLLVGHGNASRTLLRQLTRQPDARAEHLGNTRSWTGKEQPDGSYAIERYNERP